MCTNLVQFSFFFSPKTENNKNNKCSRNEIKREIKSMKTHHHHSEINRRNYFNRFDGFTLNWGWTTTRMSIHIFWICGILFFVGWMCAIVRNGIENFVITLWNENLYVFLNQLEKFYFRLWHCYRAQYSIGCKLILILFLSEMAKQCSKRQMPIHLPFIITLCAHRAHTHTFIYWHHFECVHFSLSNKFDFVCTHNLKSVLRWTIFHFKHKQFNPHLTCLKHLARELERNEINYSRVYFALKHFVIYWTLY